MAWLYIPAETGERIETICNQHYNPGRGACDCPLWPACSYSNDLTKSSAENTRIFEQGMAAALSAAQVRVDSLSAKGTPDGFAVITAQLQVHSKDEINAVMRKLNGVNGVMTVNRAKG